MRASDAAVSHLTDECVDAATACSSRVSQLYDNASVAFKLPSPRLALVSEPCWQIKIASPHRCSEVTTDRVDPALAAITSADCRAVLQREEHEEHDGA